MKKTIAALALGAAVIFAGAANAADHEIKMLNKGEKGAMVFEPDFVKAAPGDTLHIVPVDKGHSAETIKGMIPDGAEPFKGKINEEITYTLDKEGVYGIKCMPHYALGMVALVVVGEPTNLEEAKSVKQVGKAKKVFRRAVRAGRQVVERGTRSSPRDKRGAFGAGRPGGVFRPFFVGSLGVCQPSAFDPRRAASATCAGATGRGRSAGRRE